MHPDKVSRDRLNRFTDLPNVGPAFAKDLTLLGFSKPQDLAGQDARDLFDRLTEVSGQRQDPCVLDVFLSLVDFADGGRPRAWWEYTAQRKLDYPEVSLNYRAEEA